MSGSAQTDFLRRGGPMAAILDAKYETGELSREYVHHEYPKMLRRSLGVKHFDHVTEMIVGGNKTVREWTEDKEVFEEIIVNSEAEEEAVLAGGMSEGQIEEERQEMIVLAKQRGISVDPTWGLVRLQRELGAAPSSETIEVMRAKIADLEEKAMLRARIAELEAQVGRVDAQTLERQVNKANLAGAFVATGSGHAAIRERNGLPPEPTDSEPTDDEWTDIHAQLTALGVRVDNRWGLARMRQELEAATAPSS